MQANIRCPKCHYAFSVAFADMSPGKTATCLNCGEQITFAGQDAAKVQQAIDQLTRELGENAAKVTVKTKSKRPWSILSR
jgi:hypothetical protein